MQLLDTKDDKIIGFSSSTGVEMLKSRTEQFINWIFEVVMAALFKQLWVIILKTDFRVAVPAAYFLLTNKETSTYKLCLVNLQMICEFSGPQWIHLDSKTSALKSIRYVTFNHPPWAALKSQARCYLCTWEIADGVNHNYFATTSVVTAP